MSVDETEQRTADARPIPAVILAGGKAGDASAECARVGYKALAPVGGQPMVARVEAALSAAKRVDRVVVVGPPEVAAAVPKVACVPDAGSFLGNLQAGVRACGDAAHCLVISCDIPFVTGPMLDDFIARSIARGVDLAYPVVRLERCQERYPGMRRTSLRLREGRYTGGNAVVVRPELLLGHSRLIEAAFAARKNPLRLGCMIGWGVLLRILLSAKLPGVLPISLLEQRVGRMVGGSVAAIDFPDPEIGADIDKPADLASLG